MDDEIVTNNDQGFAGINDLPSKKSKRGLASASPETRKRVAKMGGEASRGGGRTRRSSS